MIEEILKQVRETEDAAAAKKKNAEECAAEIRRNADLDKARTEEEAAKNARAKAESELMQAKFRAEESFAAELAAVDDECRSIISSEEKKAEQLASELLGRVKNGDL